MSLGWILHAGDPASGIKRNTTAARRVFATASEWEQKTPHKNEFGFSSSSTSGIGPALAQLVCSLDEQLDALGLGSMQKLSAAWHSVFLRMRNKIYSLFFSSSSSSSSSSSVAVEENQQRIATHAGGGSGGGIDLEWLYIGALSVVFFVILVVRRAIAQRRPAHTQ